MVVKEDAVFIIVYVNGIITLLKTCLLKEPVSLDGVFRLSTA